MQEQVNHLAALCLQQKEPAGWLLLPAPPLCSFSLLFASASLSCLFCVLGSHQDGGAFPPVPLEETDQLIDPLKVPLMLLCEGRSPASLRMRRAARSHCQIIVGVKRPLDEAALGES